MKRLRAGLRIDAAESRDCSEVLRVGSLSDEPDVCCRVDAQHIRAQHIAE